MRRREFLKRLAIASGGLLSSAGRTAALAPQGTPLLEKSAGNAIRGLIEHNGQFFQPVQFHLPADFAPDRQGATAVVRVDGAVRYQQPFAPGTRVLEALVPAVDSERTVSIAVQIAGSSFTGTVTLKPVRKVLIYVLAHSHNDIGYTDLQANVERKQLHNIQLGIDLARKTTDYPEGSRFVWNLEGCWAPDMWMRRTNAADQGEFIDAVLNGWVALNGMYANELTGLCRPEELLQLFRRGLFRILWYGAKRTNWCWRSIPSRQGFRSRKCTACTADATSGGLRPRQHRRRISSPRKS